MADDKHWSSWEGPTGDMQKPPSPPEPSVVSRLSFWLARVQAAAGGLLALGIAAILLNGAWALGPLRWQRAEELQTLIAEGEGSLVESWWRFDFDPAFLGEGGTNWQALTSPELCGRLADFRTGSSESAVFCRRWSKYVGPWMLTDSEVAGSRTPRWLDDDGGSLMSLRFSRRAHDWLAAHQRFFWPLTPQTEEARQAAGEAGSEYQALWIEIDEPLEHLLRDWSRRADRTVPVAYDPAQPTRAVPVALKDNSSTSDAELQYLPFALAFFGFVACVMGCVFMLRGIGPKPAPYLLAAALLATVPLWGGRLGSTIGRVVPPAGSFFEFFSREMQPSPPVVLFGDEAARGASDEIVRPYSLAESFYGDFLARFELERPAETRSTDDLLRALVADLSAQLLARPDAELIAVFDQLHEYQIFDRTGVGLLFLDAARRASLDPARPAAVHRAANQFLFYLGINSPAPHPELPAYGARRELWETLADHPENPVRNAAQLVLERTR